jgi:hypothetical protein
MDNRVRLSNFDICQLTTFSAMNIDPIVGSTDKREYFGIEKRLHEVASIS